MIKFRCTIDSNDTALAGEDGYSPELARLLRKVADKVQAHQTGGKITDINGNTVGTWKVR